jgi:DNA polymerase-3 subunit gamma/tau
LGPSLYRRHRPRTFADVVGQEHVVRTLANAVERDMVHHAYLFVGSRGTGKTSMAKILAACLNCERGPTTEPCGVCESCAAIAAATSLDVIEMDAASSNSVDDIRALRESVAYVPVSGRTKVYILDEAHMLSTAAWNAFLKTLEEPPPHTIFVLATTEPQKVLPTVVDRCHRFDFQRPTAEQIAVVLRRAAQDESISLPEEAVALIARHAQGSFRDALGTLEQLQTYSGDEITTADVLAVLGVADAELLFATLDAVDSGDVRAAMLAVARSVEQGHDPSGFIRELETHARELLVVQTLDGAVPSELSLTAERDARLAAQATRIPAAVIVRLLDLLAAALEALSAGADARTQLELALFKAARPETDSTVAAALERIARLETGAASAGGAPASPASEPASVSVPPQATSDEAAETEGEQALTLEHLTEAWPAVVERVRGSNKLLAAVIENAQPVELARGRLLLAFDQESEFLRRKAVERENQLAVVEAIREVTGRAVQLAYELRELETDRRAAERPLSEEEWISRLKVEFDAEELDDREEAR